MHEHGVSGRPVQDRRVGDRRQPPRRRASRPRPVRPAVRAVGVRPAEAERPRALPAGAGRSVLALPAPRTLARRPAAAPRQPVGGRVRRALAGLAVAVAAGVVVAGLGSLADGAAAVRAGEEAAAVRRAPVVVTVEWERTPWDVARRVAPGASGPELAALAERIVTDNSLTPVSLRPGQVLTVTSG